MSEDHTTELAIFPLGTVLFPGGRLNLRIFERRYLDLITACLREDRGFGTCLIRRGTEVDADAVPHDVGTEVRIIDWEQRRDGLFGITVEGVRRFLILERWVPPGAAQRARVEWLPETVTDADRSAPEPAELAELVAELGDLLGRILDRVDGPYATIPRHLDDPAWVSGRLAELLLMPDEARQQLLELDSPGERLTLIAQALRETGRSD